MDFLDMTDEKKKNIYSSVWGKCNLPTITKTRWRKTKSKNSFSFHKREKDEKNTLIDIFNIFEKELFSKKFDMVTKGDGQELKNILVLHSSALCALLFFYNVDKKPLTMNIDERKITFNKSYFEWRNKVFNSDSNIDVVLFSEEDNIILFLESKFSEYCYSVGDFLNIPWKYYEDSVSKNIYQQLSDSSNFLSDFSKIKYISHKKEVDVFQIQCENKEYIGGVKQMISHYLGVNNYLNGKTPVKKNSYELPVNDKTRYYLGEIIFDGGLSELKFKNENRTFLSAYQAKYKELVSILNADIKARSICNLKVLNELLLYSTFKNCDSIGKEIRDFYFSE